MTSTKQFSPMDQFIESWGTLGSLWSINRSVARIHALLVATDEPLNLDQIAERLGVSRGNVSMSLRELMMWGVVVRTNQSGDRHDYFTAESDIWAMLFQIARERKRREFDPALAAVRALLHTRQPRVGQRARERLSELDRIFGTIDRLLGSLLRDDVKGRSMFGFFADLILKGSK